MTKEQERYIVDNFNLMSVEALRKQFNKKFETEYKTTGFHYHTKRLGLNKHIEHQYSKEEDEFLRTNSPLMSREDLAKEFNAKFGARIKQDAINMRCWKKGWSASDDGRFKKGSVPWQKMKGGREEYVSKLKGGNSTSFKKGRVSENARPIGTVRTSCRGELLIKTDDGWKSKRQLAWEKQYGKVPKGMKVLSVNGDKNDTNVENLRIIDNQTQILLMSNRWHKSGAEIFDAGVAYAKLYFSLREKMNLTRWAFRTMAERSNYG